MKVQIGKTLSSLMGNKNLSITELSRITGVPQSTLREWCTNRSPKNPVQVQKVVSALGVSMHYLYFGVQDDQEPIQKILKEDVFQGPLKSQSRK